MYSRFDHLDVCDNVIPVRLYGLGACMESTFFYQPDLFLNHEPKPS